MRAIRGHSRNGVSARKGASDSSTTLWRGNKGDRSWRVEEETLGERPKMLFGK
jgi:hypothetical protein